MLLQPAVAALSDKIGRTPIMITFGILGVLFTIPIFNGLGSITNPATAFMLCMSGMVIVTGYSAINAVVKAEWFPPHIRALGCSASLCHYQYLVWWYCGTGCSQL